MKKLVILLVFLLCSNLHAQVSDVIARTFIIKEILVENTSGSLVTDISHEGNPDTIPPIAVRVFNRNTVDNLADTLKVSIFISAGDSTVTYTDSIYGSGRYLRIPRINWVVTKGPQKGTISNRFLHVRVDTLASGVEEFQWISRIPEGLRVWSNDTTYQDLVR